ncbi:MAG: hypothetical protein ACJ79Q_07055 [Gemmatimonadaceae bacterium]
MPRPLIGIWLALAFVVSCRTTPAPPQPEVPVLAPRDTGRASVAIAEDTSCDRRSRVAFRREFRTLPNKYGRDAITASFGQGDHRTSVPGEVVWLVSIGAAAGLPDRGMYLTDSTGLLPISMTVVDTSTGQQLAMVSFDLPLKRNYRNVFE